jgi:uncharacterized HhH-GPD family protein
VQDEAADEVLSSNAFALLCGMLLHEAVDVDVAFAGPGKILDRFGSLDPSAIAEAPADSFAELCAAEPAIHPYPESMSVLIQAVAQFVVVNYGGDTASMWATAGSGEHLLSRLVVLPGFNKRKAQMFIALLGKQLDVRPEGWEQAAGAYGKPDSFRSVADVRDAESLEKVRNAKATRKQAADQTDKETRTGEPDALNQESRGLTDVNPEDERETTDQSEGGERAGRPAGATKKAAMAAKKAKREANQERRRQRDLADPAGAEERAAKRAAKRAAAEAAGGRPGGGKGQGGAGGGKNKAGARKGAGKKAGGGGRNRQDANAPAADLEANEPASSE